MLFVTTCSPMYSKAWVFPSLSMLPGRVVALLEPSDRRELPPNTERRDYVDGPRFQDGRFMDAFPEVPDDEVVVLFDADGIIQRKPTSDEVQLLSSVKNDQIALGPNAHPDQRGDEEIRLLLTKCSVEGVARVLNVPDLRGVRVYNFGFASATAGSWKRFRHNVGDLDVAGSCFSDPHWVQLCLCCAIHRLHMSVVDLPCSVHAHSHFGLHRGCRIRDRKLYHEDQLVFFAHYCKSVTH